MPGKFQLKQAKNGEFYFNLKAANGVSILASEMYKAKASALNGIESVKKNAAVAERFEKLTSNNGKPYFVLKAGNHDVMTNAAGAETEEAASA